MMEISFFVLFRFVLFPLIIVASELHLSHVILIVMLPMRVALQEPLPWSLYIKIYPDYISRTTYSLRHKLL